MTITFDIWLLLIGAGAGVAATALSRGRNRLLKAAVIGAVAAFLIDLAFTLF
ncbi:hypothetical protein ACJ5NV_08110 [Loktanella agnita]|uniref:hypothetical protein n=1 Tax=Loktanella agnita TaxID=287097 RepID=UPI00398837D4